jgi:hypothetical protein
MKNKIVKIVFPVKSSKNNLINISKSPVSISKTVKTIYDVVDFFEQNIFLKLELKSFTKQIKHKIKELISKSPSLKKDIKTFYFL